MQEAAREAARAVSGKFASQFEGRHLGMRRVRDQQSGGMFRHEDLQNIGAGIARTVNVQRQTPLSIGHFQGVRVFGDDRANGRNGNGVLGPTASAQEMQGQPVRVMIGDVTRLGIGLDQERDNGIRSIRGGVVQRQIAFLIGNTEGFWQSLTEILDNRQGGSLQDGNVKGQSTGTAFRFQQTRRMRRHQRFEGRHGR